MQKFSKQLPNSENGTIVDIDQCENECIKRVKEIQDQRDGTILMIDQFETDCINGLSK